MILQCVDSKSNHPPTTMIHNIPKNKFITFITGELYYQMNSEFEFVLIRKEFNLAKIHTKNIYTS